MRPTVVGIDSETHYAVLSGIEEDEVIVTGSYRVLSKELQHGMLVSVNMDDKEPDEEIPSNSKISNTRSES